MIASFPATPAVPSRAVAISRLTYSSSGSPSRPFASNLGSPGAMLELGGELGLGSSFSVLIVGVQGETVDAGPVTSGAQVGLRWAALATSRTRMAVSAGYFHELTGGDGAWGRLVLEQDLGRARLAFAVHGEHVFAAGRDGVDVMVSAGADVGVFGPVRAGIEYVGQDLEGLTEVDTEGGARHIVGGIVGVRLLADRLSLVGGPALGLGSSSPHALGRLAVSYAF